MVRDDHAFAGINGDFFPFTGAPLNLMVREGELLAAPYQSKADPEAKRATFGWGQDFSGFGFGKMVASIQAGSLEDKVDGWNVESLPDQVVVNTPAVGLVRSTAPNTYVVVKTSDAHWTPNSVVKGTVTEVGTDVIQRKVDENSFILVATGTHRQRFTNLQEGDAVTVQTRVEGFDWSKVTNVIGGGPVLVRNRQIFIDWAD